MNIPRGYGVEIVGQDRGIVPGEMDYRPGEMKYTPTEVPTEFRKQTAAQKEFTVLKEPTTKKEQLEIERAAQVFFTGKAIENGGGFMPLLLIGGAIIGAYFLFKG